MVMSKLFWIWTRQFVFSIELFFEWTSNGFKKQVILAEDGAEPTSSMLWGIALTTPTVASSLCWIWLLIVLRSVGQVPVRENQLNRSHFHAKISSTQGQRNGWNKQLWRKRKNFFCDKNWKKRLLRKTQKPDRQTIWLSQVRWILKRFCNANERPAFESHSSPDFLSLFLESKA